MKKITNKLLWIFAVGQFGWSLLSGIVSTWLIHLYTGTPEKLGGHERPVPALRVCRRHLFLCRDALPDRSRGF